MDEQMSINTIEINEPQTAESTAKRVEAYCDRFIRHTSIVSEKEYQKFFLERLEKDNGYVVRKASNFDRYFAVEREILFKFLNDTQLETMDYLRKIYKVDLEETIVNFINTETTKARGSLIEVLKHGIELSNQKLELMYTKPATTFNPELTKKYKQNIFSVMEEVWASDKERVDVGIYLNGLAIMSFELKCNGAGQSYQDAIYQFRTDRNPKTRLFMFKTGTLVNFAMDLEEVYMTTKLDGDATFFFPFNMGNGEGVTAGAEKTNSIAWLAYRLTSLHDANNKIIFNNLIIVTDRVVVGRQLQKAIMGMEHIAGLIRVMDDKCNSVDLAIVLNGNTKIIATTIQKFPYIVDSVAGLKEKRFAVIIDEVRSSTAGKDMSAVTMALGSGEEAEADVEDMISSEIKRNGKQANVSIFAFTATPKPTTIQLFGRLNTKGQREVFHVYAMKQAIEEGFILDVLQNFTEYSTFYQINKEIKDDPRCKTNAAKRQIARFIELHDTNIAQRVEVIVEHFRTSVMQELDGQAKAMVITASRQGAVKYRQAFEDFLQKSKKLLEHFKYEEQRNCVAIMRSFVRFYELLLQVSSFEDTELHKKYNYISYLLSYINIKHPGRGFNLDGKIKATNFMQKKGEGHTISNLVVSPVMKLSTAEHYGLTGDKEKRLSEIIDEINSCTGKNYDIDVVVKAMLQIRDILMKSDKLKTSAKNNTQKDFEFSYFDDIDDAFIEGLSQNQDFFSMLLSNAEMKQQVLGIFLMKYTRACVIQSKVVIKNV